MRARLVAARQAGGLDVARVLHAEHLGLGVHRGHERGQAARVGAAQRMRGAVLAATSAPGAAVRRASAWCRPSGASGCPSRCRRRPAVMVISSSSGSLASLTTSPVMSLVSDAIGSTAWSFLLNSTSWVSWSITRATLDLRSSGIGLGRAGRRAGRTTGGPARPGPARRRRRAPLPAQRTTTTAVRLRRRCLGGARDASCRGAVALRSRPRRATARLQQRTQGGMKPVRADGRQNSSLGCGAARAV